jgi:hypothetical protein
MSIAVFCRIEYISYGPKEPGPPFNSNNKAATPATCPAAGDVPKKDAIFLVKWQRGQATIGTSHAGLLARRDKTSDGHLCQTKWTLHRRKRTVPAEGAKRRTPVFHSHTPHPRRRPERRIYDPRMYSNSSRIRNWRPAQTLPLSDRSARGHFSEQWPSPQSRFHCWKIWRV